jgi:hypothetical protein
MVSLTDGAKSGCLLKLSGSKPRLSLRGIAFNATQVSTVSHPDLSDRQMYFQFPALWYGQGLSPEVLDE